MNLWSIQSKDIYWLLVENKIYRADWSKISFPEFEKPYRWMSQQMKLRGIPIENAPPIWAWPQRQKLTEPALAESGTIAVQIELKVPDDLILKSCFDGWHFVLHNDYFSLSESEFDESQNYSQEKIEASWSRIFYPDRENLKSDGWLGATVDYQATLPYLKSEWIVKGEFFRAK